MDFRIAEILSLYVLLWNCRNGQSIPEDLLKYNFVPPNMFEREPRANKTVDPIIMAAMGGIEGALNSRTIHGHILTEFDMILTKEQYDSLYEKSNRPFIRSKREAYDFIKRWPNGEIPYEFQTEDFDEEDQDNIRQAMMEWEQYTCVRFRKANWDDKNKVVFRDGERCSSNMGMLTDGSQNITLNRNRCRYRGTYLHELGHAIGLLHEHSRPDRDEFVEVFYNGERLKDFQTNYGKISKSAVDYMNNPYDYSSVMHYNTWNIRTKCPEKKAYIGNRELSYGDVEKVNTMYNCFVGKCKKKSTRSKCSPGHYDKNCLCICETGSQDCDIGGGREGSGSTCENIKDDWTCLYWKQQGDCEKHPAYMKQYCARACGLCDDMRKPEACTKSYPRDECFKWSKNGYCKNYEILW